MWYVGECGGGKKGKWVRLKIWWPYFPVCLQLSRFYAWYPDVVTNSTLFHSQKYFLLDKRDGRHTYRLNQIGHELIITEVEQYTGRVILFYFWIRLKFSIIKFKKISFSLKKKSGVLQLNDFSDNSETCILKITVKNYWSPFLLL